MKKLITIVFLIKVLTGFGQHKTELVGNVYNIDIDTIILIKSHQDLRYNGTELPIRAGEEFKYTLNHDHIEEYSLVYKSDLKNGAWRPIQFFPNGSKIEFEIYPSLEYDSNKIIGDDLGNQKKEYQRLFGEQFMKAGNEIYGAIFQLEKGTNEYASAKLRMDSLNNSAFAFQHKYFINTNNILGLNEYVELLQNAEQMEITAISLAQYQEYYLKKYFDHPLVERAINLYTALSSVKVGHAFLDIDLAHSSDSSIKLSNIIDKNYYTILDLWTPWCGPCIRKSRLIKENYSEIKDKIQVISVVGGIDNEDKAQTSINKYNYPWKSYIEISDKNGIWEKYGISNSGGGQFLINKDGIITAINPSLEEIKSLINE